MNANNINISRIITSKFCLECKKDVNITYQNGWRKPDSYCKIMTCEDCQKRLAQKPHSFDIEEQKSYNRTFDSISICHECHDRRTDGSRD